MNSKIILLTTTAIMTMALFTSCEKIKGKGEVITETRTTGTYSAINLSMTATVYVTTGDANDLQVSGQENILREIETQVESGTLVIRVKKGVIIKNYEPVRIYIKAPDVKGLDVSGSGDIFADNNWVVGDLSLNVSGSGNINIASLDATHLSAVISGSGAIKAAGGKIGREDLKISGSGTIDLRGVEAETVYSACSGSGVTYLHATNLLDATISGSGNIWYYGTPAINMHISGSGTLRRM